MTETLNERTVRQAAPSTIPERSRTGLVYGLSAYTMWGFIPLYFRAVSSVPPLIILFHRIIWSALFMALVVSVRLEWKSIWPVLRSRRNILMLSAGGRAYSLDSLLFLYAVASTQVLQFRIRNFFTTMS